MRPSSTIFSALLWPVGVVRANSVYLLFFGAISIVWFAGWAKSVDHKLGRTRSIYPALTRTDQTLSRPEHRLETAEADPEP